MRTNKYQTFVFFKVLACQLNETIATEFFSYIYVIFYINYKVKNHIYNRVKY